MAQPLLTEPVTQAPLAEMSYEDFLRWEEAPEHTEWVDGKVYLMSPVTNLHAQLVKFLLRVVSDFVDSRKLGDVFFDPFQMKIGPDLPGRAPDLFFVKTANLGRLKRVYFDGPADLVVEVISPGSRAVDRGKKFYEYEEGGVLEFWLIDPQRNEAEFFLLGADKRYHAAALRDGVYHSKALDGFWLKVGWLWEHPMPPVRSVLKELGVL